MHESKIAIKLEEEMKPLKKICEHLEEAVKNELTKGTENIDTNEMGEVIDMIKDIYEAKEKLVKACYYKQIMEAMEESEYDEDYDEEGPLDEGRMYYRGQPRDSMGRYTSRRGRRGRRGYEQMPMYHLTPEMYHMPMDEWNWDRDMDREGMGRMYYSEGNRGGSTGGSRGGSSSGNQGSSMSSSQGGSSSGMSGSSGGSSGGGSSRGYSEGYSDGYSDGRSQGQRNQKSSRSENARRGYEESKMMQDGSPESKKKAMESLEHYMKELGEDMSELIGKMDASEKSMLKNKLQVLAQKVQ